jgi:Carbohydrate esterase 2 N-terminal
MKLLSGFAILFITFQLLGFSGMPGSKEFIPANNTNIQYFGRRDMSDSLHPKHSWPGIYIYAEFSGSSVGVRMNDNVNYYNVYIDGKLHSVFHGTKQGEADYILADSLSNTHHTFRFSQRNISFGIYTFCGLLLDKGAKLYTPPPKPTRKIEFIGDSYTAAEGNEATQAEMEWDKKFPVTNIDKGFAPIVARHFNARYHTTCRSGIGMACDWQGNYDFSMRYYFDRTLMENTKPKWNFKQWVPNLVVICLGLNDHTGLVGKDGKVSDRKSEIFRNVYHEFLDSVGKVYPGVPVLAVAAQLEWIHKNVKQVVDEEKAKGHDNVYYAEFGSYPGGYVANDHPNVETHRKIADVIIKTIDSLKIFTAKN